MALKYYGRSRWVTAQANGVTISEAGNYTIMSQYFNASATGLYGCNTQYNFTVNAGDTGQLIGRFNNITAGPRVLPFVFWDTTERNNPIFIGMFIPWTLPNVTASNGFYYGTFDALDGLGIRTGALPVPYRVTPNSEPFYFDIYSYELGNTEITLTGDSNISQINVNEVAYTSFPQTVQIADGDVISAYGKTSVHALTLQNVQNMKQVQIGNTVYNTFPVTLNISQNTTIQLSGADDKTVTINYTNTKTPVITNT